MIVDLFTYYRFAFLLLFPPRSAECEPVCARPYSCVTTRECAERHAMRGTEEVLFQCARKTKVCCPPVQNTVINPTLPEIQDTTEHQPQIKKTTETKSKVKYFTEYDYLKKFNFTSHRNADILANSERCGNGLYTDKVSQGEEADLGEFPWMVLIGYRGKRDPNKRTFFCGGTLINDYYVLTAAHCTAIKEIEAEPQFVRLGEHDISKEVDCFKNQGISESSTSAPQCLPKYKDIAIEKIIRHDEWNESTIRNDIALLRLSENATDGEHYNIGSICLPLEPSLFNLTNTTIYEVAGWGKTDAHRDHGSNKLMKAQHGILGISLNECNKICNNTLNRAFCPIKESQMCIEGVRGVDVCKGDSGGPMMLRHRTKTFQIGIVSFKSIEDCGEQTTPSIFTNVMHYLPWILDHIEP